MRYRVAFWLANGLAIAAAGMGAFVLLPEPSTTRTATLATTSTSQSRAVLSTTTPSTAAPDTAPVLVTSPPRTVVTAEQVQTGTAPGLVACSGGNSKKPFVAVGPIKLTGLDVYGLDRNHDGIACNNG